MSDYPIFEEGTERSFTTGRTAAEQEAWVTSQEPEDEMVELTIRVPEQFFTQKFLKSDWDKAVAAVAEADALPEGQVMPIDHLWDKPEYLTHSWRSDLDVDQELYGPDGHQVPLW